MKRENRFVRAGRLGGIATAKKRKLAKKLRDKKNAKRRKR